MRGNARLVPLILTFAGTGAAGLLAEQSFEKLLSTLLGTATSASAVVLATYFGGLMLGGIAYGRLRRRVSGRSPTLRAYGALEAWIAVACAILALTSSGLPALFEPVLVLGAAHPALLIVVRLLVAASWLLPITVPMGATFPAVVDALDSLIDEADPETRARIRGGRLSALYTSNLLGAIAAAALGPYVILPRFGLDGTLWFAAGLDLTAALVSFTLAFTVRGVVGVPVESAPAPDAATTSPPRALLVVAGLSGMLLFSLEVVWTHLIGTVINSSVYAFAMMLTIVLTGLGLGAAGAELIASRVRSVRTHLPGLAMIAAWGALTLSQSAWPHIPHALSQAVPFAATFAQAEQTRALGALGQLLPTSALLGMVYPLLLRVDVLPRSGGAIGVVGAANAVGSIVGALSALFVWIPVLGAEWTLRCIAGLCLASGVLLVLGAARRGWVRGVVGLGAAGALALTMLATRWDRLELTSGEQVYFRRMHVGPKSSLRFFAEDPAGGFTTVAESPGPENRTMKVMLSNGKFQGNDSGEMAAQNAFALIPMMFVRGWHEALVIGLGTGRSAQVVASMAFDHVTVAEISTGIVDAARTEFGHVNGDILARPNVTLALTDARNRLLVDPTPHDLISMEISSVWIAGATNLYAREFYELCKRRLRETGILQQWIQLHHIGLDEVEAVIATVRDVFPYVSFYFEGGQGIVLASNQPQLTQSSFFERLERSRTELQIADIDGLSTHLHASRLLRASDVDTMLAATHPKRNTDANRFLEYATPKHLLDGVSSRPNIDGLARWSSFTPQEVDTSVSGALADHARALTPRDVKHELGLE